MSFDDDEVESDELDLLADPQEESTSDITDSYNRNVLLGVDEEALAEAIGRFPDHVGFRSLADRAIRLGLLLGDKEALIADFVADIQSELLVFSTEIAKDPSRIVMSVLATLPDDQAIVEIEKLMGLLGGRLKALMASKLHHDEEPGGTSHGG